MNPSSLTTDGKYLTVELAGEAYGIAALKIREIIRLQKITPVAQAPASVQGVINLRGRVIAVIDLRVRFGLPALNTARTCIVVVQIPGDAGRIVPLGLIVDAVEEVVTLTPDDVCPTPEFGARIDTRCLLGIAKVNGRVTTLLEIDRVMSTGSVGRDGFPD